MTNVAQKSQTEQVTDMARQLDLEAVTEYMNAARRMGVTPSDVVSKGLSYAEDYVSEQFPGIRRYAAMRLALYLAEEGAKAVGVHAGLRKASK